MLRSLAASNCHDRSVKQRTEDPSVTIYRAITVGSARELDRKCGAFAEKGDRKTLSISRIAVHGYGIERRPLSGRDMQEVNISITEARVERRLPVHEDRL